MFQGKSKTHAPPICTWYNCNNIHNRNCVFSVLVTCISFSKEGTLKIHKGNAKIMEDLEYTRIYDVILTTWSAWFLSISPEVASCACPWWRDTVSDDMWSWRGLCTPLTLWILMICWQCDEVRNLTRHGWPRHCSQGVQYHSAVLFKVRPRKKIVAFR